MVSGTPDILKAKQSMLSSWKKQYPPTPRCNGERAREARAVSKVPED